MKYSVAFQTETGIMYMDLEDVAVIAKDNEGWYFERKDDKEELTTLLFIKKENMVYYKLEE